MEKFTPPYRVGRKQNKAIVDGNGHQVAFFSEGAEDLAKASCEYLNILYTDKDNKDNAVRGAGIGG